MPTKIEPRLPRGMRDILPKKMILRRYVISTIEDVFERFGFEPLQTPALELSETLIGQVRTRGREANLRRAAS